MSSTLYNPDDWQTIQTIEPTDATQVEPIKIIQLNDRSDATRGFAVPEWTGTANQLDVVVDWLMSGGGDLS
jgi:hypothetical protein